MRKFTATLAAVAATTLTTGLLAGPPAAVADTPKPSLTIEPADGSFTGGTQLTLRGHLGVTGRKRIQVQRNLNRVGDPWGNMKNQQNVTGWSNPDGSFEIKAPAGAMWNIRYRVISGNGKHVTPARATNAVAQEAIVTQESPAVVGRDFTLQVDTVGADFPGFRDLPGVLLPGRNVTIQRRVNAWKWQDVGNGTVDNRGFASINVTAPGSAGTQTYRARLADWKQNGDNIGWTASFPIDVRVTRSSSSSFAPNTARQGAAASSADVAADEAHTAALSAKINPHRRHAAQVNNWGRNGFRFSYDWAFGESLTTNPVKGKNKRGQWVAASDGTGRTTLRNGGMLLASDGYRNARQSGVRGSVWSTLQGNAFKRGRWELRGITTPRATGGKQYRVRYELVPAGTKAKCTPSGIVIAQTTKPGAPVRFGVRNARGVTWAKQFKPAVTPGADSYAVQVTKKHITWFHNGKTIATLRNKAAIPKTKMTVRVSMVGPRGNANPKMRSTKTTVDWVRSYGLKAGKKATSRKGLKKGAALPRC